VVVERHRRRRPDALLTDAARGPLRCAILSGMTNDVPGTPVAGWYDDPHVPGQLRWWDGRVWTDGVQPAPGAQGAWWVSPPPPARAPRRLWWIVGLTAAGLATAAVVASVLVIPAHVSRAVRVHVFTAGSAVAVPPGASGPDGGPVYEQNPQLWTDLNQAGDAMDAAFSDSSGYPIDIGQTDYQQDPSETVWVVSADYSSYCLAGGPDRSSPQMWYSSDDGEPSDQPCG
jgi:hypothetical protein